MTPAERQAAFNRAIRAVLKDRTALMTGTRDELVQLLKAAERAIRDVLAEQPSDYERWSLPRIQADIRVAIDELNRDAGAEISKAAGKAWELGQDMAERPLEAAMPEARIGVSPRLMTTGTLTAMRNFMVARIRDIGLEARNRIFIDLGLVTIGAIAPGEAVTRVTKVLGETSRLRATTIVRTELGRAFSTAAQARMKQAAKLVPGLQKQWRRSGKLHPRLHHDIIDGQIRDVDKPFDLTPFGKPKVQLMFPRDPAAPAGETINCGCESIPYKASWKVLNPGREPGDPRLDDDGDTLAAVLARQKRKPAPAPA